MSNYITVLGQDTWSESGDSYVIILGDVDIHDFAQDGIPSKHAYETVNVRVLLRENERLHNENYQLMCDLQKQVQKGMCDEHGKNL
jgi:hypothetical protein